MATPEVVIDDLTPTSEHAVFIVVLEDDTTGPPDHGTTAPAPLMDDVRAMQQAYANKHDTTTTTTITELAAAQPPTNQHTHTTTTTITEPTPTARPPRADDAYTTQDVYPGDKPKSDLKMMKAVYTRRWVADNAESPATQPSSSTTNHTATSNSTWSTTSSERSTSTCCSMHWMITTIANQVRVILAGRIVNRQEVMCQVLSELSDIFNMAMLPEFKESIVDEVLEQARPLATL